MGAARRRERKRRKIPLLLSVGSLATLRGLLWLEEWVIGRRGGGRHWLPAQRSQPDERKPGCRIAAEMANLASY